MARIVTRETPTVCQYCGESIEVGEEIVQCRNGYLHFHKQCWRSARALFAKKATTIP